ncbi:hypothetical protein [Shewanella maritima]|uniref:hypothetical protein n=1 Tax=Shewanella maritima TaxID=2520507 RepID=UPI0037362952
MKSLNITISNDKIQKLIASGHLCAADFQCLDKQTKQAVWQICLVNCQKRVVCNHQQAKLDSETMIENQTLSVGQHVHLTNVL